MKTFAFLAALAAAGTSQALVLISNYPQTNDTSLSAGLTTARMKALGFIMPGQSHNLVSIKVRLQFSATSVQIPFMTIEAAGTPTSPGGSLYTMTAPGGYTTGVGDYVFTTSSTFTLQANTKYWVRLSGANGTQAGMDWTGSSPAITPTGLATHDGSLFTSNSGALWTNSATLNTYEIVVADPIPEPATIGLLGLAGLVLARRRK